jgi:hypothetical protein
MEETSMAEQILEGTWEEVQMKLYTLRLSGRRVQVTIRDMNDADKEPSISKGKMITFGMFPELQGLTDEDFANAEYRDTQDEY